MLYFAYGSNMDWAQMQKRCPSATFVCIARASQSRLAFTHLSLGRKCGVADMVPSKGDVVWGAVFQIDETEIGALDKSEGYQPGRLRERNSYERIELHVFREGKDGEPLSVWTYLVVKKLDPNPKPTAEYKLLIVEGARRWRLPETYIQQLEAIEAQ